MKKNEIIELNGIEYTIEINRDSAVKIEQYAKLKENLRNLTSTKIIDYKDEILEDENPFAEKIDYEKMEEEAQEKLALLRKIVTRAFWIWLYPVHKFNINQIEEILKPYLEDDKQFDFIMEKYSSYMEESTVINEKYLEEQKNLKALANKKN